MILDEHYTLANGVRIPKLGLGTWFINNEEAPEAVRTATDIGYRHIDTAQAYGNEQGVGEGVRGCGVDRDDLFVTTKLAAEAKSHGEATAAIDGSLSTLGLDHIDLMLIHSPRPWMQFHEDDRHLEGNREAWRALEDAHRAGKLRAIGVSNFDELDVANIVDACTVRPMVNQVLAHISNTPRDLIARMRDLDILVEAHSPIAHGELMKNTTVAEMAGRYGVSVPQLSIRYLLQLGLLPLPKTANPAHMRDNAGVDFEISEEDMRALITIDPIADYGEAGMWPVYGGRLG
ncbi:MAG: aldo/keto reductase [Thermoleophilia bacterium]|nr:aldo/keto reductase [Thermoleophilia bacterium]